MGEEAVKLLRALASGPTASDQVPPTTEHTCSTGWCPVCQVVGFAKQNPDVVDQLADSAATFARSVRDVLERAVDRQEKHP